MTGDISFIVMNVILQPAGPKYTSGKSLLGILEECW